MKKLLIQGGVGGSVCWSWSRIGGVSEKVGYSKRFNSSEICLDFHCLVPASFELHDEAEQKTPWTSNKRKSIQCGVVGSAATAASSHDTIGELNISHATSYGSSSSCKKKENAARDEAPEVLNSRALEEEDEISKRLKLKYEKSVKVKQGRLKVSNKGKQNFPSLQSGGARRSAIQKLSFGLPPVFAPRYPSV